jgi:apolipoprotein N-acyltransferase
VVIVFSLASGALLCASFAPISWWWLAPFALALLLKSLHGRRFHMRLLSTLAFGFAFFAPLLSWTNTYVGDLPWLLLVTSQIALFLPLSLLPFQKSRPLLLFAFPSLWLICEWMTARIPFGGFGWGRVAFSQASAPYSKIARYGGAPSISFTVGVLAVAIVFFIHKDFKLFGTLVLSLSVAIVFLTSLSIIIPKTNFTVLAVQGGVPEMGLDFNARATQVFQMHLAETNKFLSANHKHIDVILWPENAVDVDPFKTPSIRNQLDSIANKFNIPMIVGAVTYTGSNYRNESILWEPGRGATSRYIKQHLTPFGEYVPLRAIAEFFSPYARDIVDFVPGKKGIDHYVGRAIIAPIICFELIDDSLGREMTRHSNLVVVQTNSATFGNGAESLQQLGITRIRAIEHGKFVISVSTTGVSSVVDPRGRTSHKTSLGEINAFSSDVSLIIGRTFSDRNGAVIEALLVFAPFILVLVMVASRRRANADKDRKFSL